MRDYRLVRDSVPPMVADITQCLCGRRGGGSGFVFVYVWVSG
jgi:hypothetical protein